MNQRLIALGWNGRIAADFDELAPAGSIAGRVGRVDRGECNVFTQDGEVRALSDSQRAQADVAPATGDWVAVADDPELGLVVAAVLPRLTSIVRRDPSEQVIEQVLVANVDVVAVVHGLDRPVNPAQLERFLILAWDSGAQPVVVLTKADLVAAEQIPDLVRLATVAPDVAVIVTSVETGEGLDDFRQFVANQRSLVLLGPSGVGKSTLVNALVGDEIQETGQVREGDAKGRHTTTRRELIELPGGGVLIDTPGIRAVGVWEADLALDRVFADIAELAEQCRFRDCTHRTEPSCAVVAAVESNDLDADRLDRYLNLWDEITRQAEDAEVRARSKQRGRRRKR